MIRCPHQRASIAIFSTLLFHTSIAYAIYAIESTVILKEITSSDISFVSLAEVNKEQSSVPQEKQEEQTKPEKKQKTEHFEKVVQQKIVQKSITPPLQKAVPLETKTAESLNIQSKTPLEINESIAEYQDKHAPRIKQIEAENSEQIEKYLSKVRAKIQSNIKYPLLAKKLRLEGESVIEFVILKSGYVDELSIVIKESSGHESLDKQAIKTLLSVLPFDIPPKNNMAIILPVVFQLNKN